MSVGSIDTYEKLLGYFLAGKTLTGKQKDLFFPWSVRCGTVSFSMEIGTISPVNTVLHVHTYGQIISLFGSDFYDTQYQTVVLCHLQELPLVNHSPNKHHQKPSPILIDTFILGLFFFGSVERKVEISASI